MWCEATGERWPRTGSSPKAGRSKTSAMGGRRGPGVSSRRGPWRCCPASGLRGGCGIAWPALCVRALGRCAGLGRRCGARRHEPPRHRPPRTASPRSATPMGSGCRARDQGDQPPRLSGRTCSPGPLATSISYPLRGVATRTNDAGHCVTVNSFRFLRRSS